MTNDYHYIIIDDEPKAIKLLNSIIRRLYKDLQEMGSYTEWTTALAALESNEADLVFIDISMPHRTGINLLEMVPHLDCEIIFVTAHEDYALEVFKFSPVGYILKPIIDANLKAFVDKAISRIDNKKAALRQVVQKPAHHKNRIGIRNNSGLDYIDIDDILFFEAITRYTRVVTKDKSYVSSYNLGKFKEMVKSDHFFLVHRSYIVNINRVVRYEGKGIVIMENGHEIPVSKNTREDFLHLFAHL